jgi:hypothetical protein
MSPLLRKEIRLILPFWGIALFLAIIPSWFLPRYAHVLGLDAVFFWTLGFGLILLSLAPFGQEFALGTFSTMLAQPLERARLWRTKILLTTIAALLVLGAFAIAVHLRFDAGLRDEMQRLAANHETLTSQIEAAEASERLLYAQEFRHACESAGLLLLVAVTGGFWTTLLFRQTGAALWFAILIPGVLSVVIAGVFQTFIGHGTDSAVAVVLSLYAIAGFIWARRMFLQAQDSQWLGETISLLALSPARTQTESATARTKGATRALLRKELQSHQISLLIAFGLLVLHVCTLVFRKFYTLERNSEFRFALEAVPLLWLLVPWLIGSVAVAEERRLGTMESQLCLPVTRRLQFWVKFVVVFFFGILLGGLMPCLLEWLGTTFGVFSEIVQSRASASVYFVTVLEIVVASAGIALVSFFASSLTRNTLHALGAAIAIGGSFYALAEWLFHNSNYYNYSLWKGPLVSVAEWPVWIVALIWLSFSNYKRLHAGQNVWARNLIILFSSIVLTGLATAVVYQRPWEFAMSLEPRHGTAQLSGAVRPVISMASQKAVVLLPDGRLWVATDYHFRQLDGYEERSDVRLRIQAAVPASGMFVAGSNWVALAADYMHDIVALRSDGTLWDICSYHSQGTNGFHRMNWLSQSPDPRRIGSGSDWKSVVAGDSYFLALKTDGTLWNLPGNVDGWDSGPPPYYLPSNLKVPAQVGTNSDWAGLFGGQQEMLLMKNGGDMWAWENGLKEVRAIYPLQLNGSDWVAAGGGLRSRLVIHQDGSLWGRSQWESGERVFGSFVAWRQSPDLVRIGHETDWVQLAGSSPGLFAIKKDGRLVKNETEPFASVLNRPSQYSDWIAVSAHWDEMAALAADGTISLWKDTRRDEGIHLAPTRRPLWNLNIFTDTKD